MKSRRDWIAQAVSLLAVAGLRRDDGSVGGGREVGSAPTIRDEFPIVKNRVYLNNASVHPMSTSTRRVVDAYFEGRNHGAPTPDVPVDIPRVKALYAKLIGAQASDIALVPSTTVGENLVVSGLRSEERRVGKEWRSRW